MTIQDLMHSSKPTEAEQRKFWVQVEKDGGCWEFRNGSKDQEHQLYFDYRGDNMKASTFAWLLSGRTLDKGQEPVAKCKNLLCVYPTHQRLVSVSQVTSTDQRHERVTRPPVRLKQLPPPDAPSKSRYPIADKSIRASKVSVIQPIMQMPPMKTEDSIEVMALRKWLEDVEKSNSSELNNEHLDRTFPRPEPYWWEVEA